MPVLAVLPGGVGVGVDEHELGVAVDARGRRVDVERPEAPPEGEVLLVVDGLVAEEDDPVLDEGAVDLVERLVVERLAQVDPGDLGPDRRGEGVCVDAADIPLRVSLPSARRAKLSGR